MGLQERTFQAETVAETAVRFLEFMTWAVCVRTTESVIFGQRTKLKLHFLKSRRMGARPINRPQGGPAF